MWRYGGCDGEGNYYNEGRDAGMERETTTMDVEMLGWRGKLLQWR